jgi:hypothetical protein
MKHLFLVKEIPFFSQQNDNLLHNGKPRAHYKSFQLASSVYNRKWGFPMIQTKLHPHASWKVHQQGNVCET